MEMTRIVRFAASVVVGAALFAGCNKPSKDDCRKAIENMRVLMHTEHLHTDVEGEVRRCNGGSKKAAVDCAIKAATLEDLRACKFMHIPDDIGTTGSATGSAAGSATGSAAGSATGSADVGSGSAGSATGSADVGSGSAGSAAGSADVGSGSAGSASGSAGSGI